MPAGSAAPVVMESPEVVMLIVRALETAPPGLTTVTLAVPALAIKFCGTVALNCALVL